MDVKKFKEFPLMGILRDIKLDAAGKLVETVLASGLKCVEVTMNTSGAAKLIKSMKGFAKGDLMIGAGTVLTMDDLRQGLDSGASFIVMPTLVVDVMAYCAKRSIPVFPGAFSPQEVYNCWQAGATMVKVFPAKFFGPDYIKELKGPFKNVELLACGGVNPDNIGEFFSCGASAVAFGGSIFKKEWIDKGEFSKIAEGIKALIAGWNTKAA
jgi:2-dehydro-3-deoxyphosphogluconate aldolase/(4S)-4-hydroxy-2-oxoglutarate aldolase